jgi:hypothetical protein
MSDRMKTVAIALAAALVAFAAGSLWQYGSTRPEVKQLQTTERDLALQRLEGTLATATIEAMRGGYEIARQLGSDFFTGLQAHYPDSDPQRQQALQEILAGRDLIITALSRADPQSGSMLVQLFMRYRIALGEPVGPESGANSPSPPTTGRQ